MKIITIYVIGALFAITVESKTGTIDTLEDLRKGTIEDIKNGRTDPVGGAIYLEKIHYWMDKLVNNDSTDIDRLTRVVIELRIHRNKLLDRYERRFELRIRHAELKELTHHLRVLDTAIAEGEELLAIVKP